MELVTGRAGTPHITSQQDRQRNQGTFGDGAYILKTGNQLDPVVQSSNKIQIKDGALMFQGALFSVKVGTVDEVTIANGSQGMQRKDLIVARYTYDAGENVESAAWAVIQGTPAASNPVTPEYTEGDIQAGDTTVECPVFIVTLDGINITGVELVPEIAPDVPEIMAQIEALNSKFPIITSLGTYQNGVIDLHDAKIIYGVYPLHAFIPDTSSGGYKADIDLSDYGFTGEMWASVTPRYPNGHPYVSIASVSASKVTLLSDVNVSGAYAQWSVIGKTN